MANLRLTDKADVGVMYDADIQRFDPELICKLGVTREMAIARFDRCPSVGFEIEGKAVGGFLLDGQVVHLAVLSEYHGRWALLWKPALTWLFSVQDPAFTEIEIDNEKCIRLFERSNFKRVGSADTIVRFELSARHMVQSRRVRRCV